MTFVELCYPWLLKKNWYQILVVGCSLLSTSAKLFINYTRPMPCNFFLTLIGSPAAGKGRIIDCVNAVLSDIDWLYNIPTGSVEGIEEVIDSRRIGFLIWDEMGELSQGAKKGDYLSKIKYLFNRMYYLDKLERIKASKKPVSIPANGYYISIILAGLPEDWKNIRDTFLGGFERRFLPLKIERTKTPFEDYPTDDRAIPVLLECQNMLDLFKDKQIIVEPLNLERYKDTILKIDDRYWTLFEEYIKKLAACLILNDLTAESISQISKGIKISDQPILISNDIHDILMISNDIVISDKNPSSFSDIKYHILDDTVITLLDSHSSIPKINDAKYVEMLNKIDEHYKRTGEFIVHKTYLMKVILEVTNPKWFEKYYRAFIARGDVRIVKVPEGKPDHVIKPTLTICYNCKWWDECSKDNWKLIEQDEWDVNKAKECGDFEFA
jgi:hypothetical protein